MLINKKLNPIVTGLFIRRRKLNISFVLITQSCFPVRRNVRLISTNYFIKKIPNKHKLQQNEFNHSSDIGFQGFTNLSKKLQQNHILFIDSYYPCIK